MQDKKVRISVEDSKLKDLGRTATELANDMIKSSRQYSTSSKEVLKDLEDQIRLIEKRHKVELEGQKRVIDQEKNLINQSRHQDVAQARKIEDPTLRRKGIAEAQTLYSEGQSRVGDMQSHFNKLLEESKKQTAGIRDQIEAIKQTSKNEIREDRIGVEKSLRGDKSINKLGIQGDPQEALKRTIQQALLGDLGEEETEQRGKFKAFGKFGRGGGRAFNTAASLGTSKNEFYAGAAILGMTPFVGQGLSNIATRLLSSSEGIGTEKEMFARANRMSIDSVNKMDLPSIARDKGSIYGMNAQEVMSRGTSYFNVAKNYNSGVDVNRLLSAESNLGLSQQDISGLYESSRHRVNNYKYKGDEADLFSGNQDIPQLISTFNRFLRDSNQTQSVLPEILNSYKTIASQIGQSGFVDAQNLSRSITGIAGASGLEGQHLDRFLGGVQGLSRSSNPITKSLMMRSFRKSNPNASLWDIQSMMESPFEHLDEMGGFMSNLKKQTGGGDTYKQVLYSLFEGKLDRRDIDLITDKNADLGKVLQTKGVKGSIDAELGSEGVVSEMTSSQKAMDAMFQDFGDKAVVWSNNLMKTLEGQINGMFSGDSSDVEENKKEEYRKLREAVSDGVVEGYMQTKYMP